MYERFTDRARKVMQFANKEAQRFRHEYIGTEHILLGLVKEGAGVAANVLKNLDIDLRKVRKEVEQMVQPAPDMATMGKLPQTPRAKKAVEYAIEEARALNHNYVGTEHLLLGLLREEEGVAAQVLMNLGLKLEDVREEVLNLLGHNVEPQKQRTPALNSVGRNLTQLAQEGILTPVVGRQNEIERLLLVLSCRPPNNPLLVGEVGVGKTAIVEGLAQVSAAAGGRGFLDDRRIIALNMARNVAHSGNRGIEEALAEIRQAKNLVLFIADLQSLTNTSGSAARDYARNVVYSALSRGEVQCIATTTPAGYHADIVNDGFLGRLFRPIAVRPTTQEETVAILGSQRPLYESHHRVRIGDDALQAAVDLAELHLPDGCLPGKAVQLLDEACALVRWKNAPQRPELREWDVQIEQLNREKEEAVANQDFARAAELRDQADELMKQREMIERQTQREAQQVVGTVDKEAVAEAVARMTGVPPHRP